MYFDRHVGLFRLNGEWKRLLRNWKFQGDRNLYRIFLPRWRRIIPRMREWAPDRIGYIDSGGARALDRRSYSPCRDLARAVGADIGLTPEPDLLKCRQRKGDKQSGRGFSERFLEIRNSLKIRKNFDGVAGSTYLLIEDVFTTGATANEAARVLKDHGVKKVLILSMLHREEYDD